MSERAPYADRDRLLAALRLLVRPVTVGGVHGLALAETERPFNRSEWLWADDNAKAAELLCLPEVWDADPALGRGVLDFLLAMSEGDLILRRWAAPQLEILVDDPRGFVLINPHARFEGDLSRGKVAQGARFNDDRAGSAVLHTGNMVNFTFRGRRQTVDVENGITSTGIRHTAGGAVLHHEGRVEARGWYGPPMEAGTIRYEYLIAADHPVVRLRVTLRVASGVRLREVRLSTAYDGIGLDGAYRLVTTVAPGRPPVHSGAVPDGPVVLHQGPLEYLGLAQDGMPGFVHGLHLRPLQPGRVHEVRAAGQKGGALHWVALLHAVGDLENGAEVTVEEDRMLTAGGDYGDPAPYRAMLREPGLLHGRDPSISYDHGAELNAVATHLLHAAAGRYRREPPDAARQARLRAWFDRNLATYFRGLETGGVVSAERVFPRGMAFTVMALDAMHRATGDTAYADRLAAALDLLLLRQQEGGAFTDPNGEPSWLDCHAAALLALARVALRDAPDQRVAPAIRRALGALRHGTVPVDVGGETVAFDTLVVRSTTASGRMHEDGALWTNKLGLLLRALDTVATAAAAGTLALPAPEVRRVTALRARAEALIGDAVRDRGADGLEVLTSPFSGETNSETQPWVALGLLRADAVFAEPAVATAA